MSNVTNNSNVPFYNPNLSYDDNCKNGPFGGFADGTVNENKGDPIFDFFGYKVFLPFGIPAGPVPNSNFVKSSFEKGFDIVMYKTVRTNAHKCNTFPNIIPVKHNGKITLTQAKEGLVADKEFKEPIAITNSFGVPSLSPEEWMPDLKKSVKMAGKGQILVGTYQGSNRGEGEAAFINDWVLGAKLLKKCGVKVMELNLSCPNEGKAQLLCHDTETVLKIATAVKEEVGNIPILVKISYFTTDKALENFIIKLAPFVDGFDTINTIAGKIYNENGEQALPGEGRLISGVCGAPIKWAGVEMVSRIAKIRKKINGKFFIIGTGGVVNVSDYREYIDAGADAVMSATGAMWNADLARDIKQDIL
jgi:dihydroorotate dehydrogenase